MKKKITLCFCLLMMVLGIQAFALSASPSPATVKVNGSTVSFEAYSINGNNYFKLRDLAKALSGTNGQFAVGWNSKTKNISLTTGKGYTAIGGELSGTAGSSSVNAVSSPATVTINGNTVSLKAYTIKSYTFFQLRDLCTKLNNNISVDWEPNNKIVTVVTSTQETTPTPTPTPTPTGKTIVVDAGHGGSDPGAQVGGYNEKTYTLAIALKLGAKLQSRGINVIYTRTTDTYPTLTERAAIANNADADYFISIHLNSADSSSAKGVETLVYANSGAGYWLGTSVQKQIIASTGATNRGVKERPNLVVLNKTNMPAILVETGFMSNSSEMSKLASAAYQDTMAGAIAQGVYNYLGM